MSMNAPAKTPEILNIADDLLLQNWACYKDLLKIS